MRAVAQRLVRGALAGAEPDFLGVRRLRFLWPEFAAFVRAVAERLRLGAPAGAPPVAFAGLDIDRDRLASADFTFTHLDVSPFSLAVPDFVRRLCRRHRWRAMLRRRPWRARAPARYSSG